MSTDKSGGLDNRDHDVVDERVKEHAGAGGEAEATYAILGRKVSRRVIVVESLCRG